MIIGEQFIVGTLAEYTGTKPVTVLFPGPAGVLVAAEAASGRYSDYAYNQEADGIYRNIEESSGKERSVWSPGVLAVLQSQIHVARAHKAPPLVSGFLNKHFEFPTHQCNQVTQMESDKLEALTQQNHDNCTAQTQQNLDRYKSEIQQNLDTSHAQTQQNLDTYNAQTQQNLDQTKAGTRKVAMQEGGSFMKNLTSFLAPPIGGRRF